VEQRKKKHASEDFVKAFLSSDVSNPTTYEEIDDNFLQHLFAHWLRNDDEFNSLRRQYKKLASGKFPIHRSDKNSIINPTDLKRINETIGETVFSLKIDDTQVNVVIPKQVRAVLFKDWNKNTRLTGVIPAFGNFSKTYRYINFLI
jgi:hypothetical protein